MFGRCIETQSSSDFRGEERNARHSGHSSSRPFKPPAPRPPAPRPPGPRPPGPSPSPAPAPPSPTPGGVTTVEADPSARTKRFRAFTNKVEPQSNHSLTPEQIEKAHAIQAAYIHSEEGPAAAQQYLDKNNSPYGIDHQVTNTDAIGMLHNRTGEGVVAIRGVNSKNIDEWKGIAKMFKGDEDTVHHRNAKAVLDKLKNKYELGPDQMEILGHSRGGAVAITLGENAGIPTTTMNPWITPKQSMDAIGKVVSKVKSLRDRLTGSEGVDGVLDAGDQILDGDIRALMPDMEAKHDIIRTVNDPTSLGGAAFTPNDGNWNVKTIAENQKTISPFKSHALENFTNPRPGGTTENRAMKANIKVWNHGTKLSELKHVKDMMEYQTSSDRGPNRSFTKYIKEYSPYDAQAGQGNTLSSRIRNLRDLWERTGGTLTDQEINEVGDEGIHSSRYEAQYGRNTGGSREGQIRSVRHANSDQEINSFMNKVRNGRSQRHLDSMEKRLGDLVKDADGANSGHESTTKSFYDEVMERGGGRARQGIAKAADIAVEGGKKIGGALESLPEDVKSALHPTNVAEGVFSGLLGGAIANQIDPDSEHGSGAHKVLHDSLSGGLTGVIGTGVGAMRAAGTVKGLAGLATAGGAAEAAAGGVAGAVGMVAGGAAQRGVQEGLQKAGASKDVSEAAGDVVGGAAGMGATVATGQAIAAAAGAAGLGATEGAEVGAFAGPAGILLGAGVGAVLGGAAYGVGKMLGD